MKVGSESISFSSEVSEPVGKGSYLRTMSPPATQRSHASRDLTYVSRANGYDSHCSPESPCHGGRSSARVTFRPSTYATTRSWSATSAGELRSHHRWIRCMSTSEMLPLVTRRWWHEPALRRCGQYLLTTDAGEFGKVRYSAAGGTALFRECPDRVLETHVFRCQRGD